jgi:hypothetical protein
MRTGEGPGGGGQRALAGDARRGRSEGEAGAIKHAVEQSWESERREGGCGPGDRGTGADPGADQCQLGRERKLRRRWGDAGAGLGAREGGCVGN